MERLNALEQFPLESTVVFETPQTSDEELIETEPRLERRRRCCLIEWICNVWESIIEWFSNIGH